MKDLMKNYEAWEQISKERTENNMQAVLLAAGESSRFNPYNNFSHKSLVKILGKPIIEHTLFSIKNTGIKDVIVIHGKDNKVKEAIGNGNKLGLRITYLEQEQSLGMGDALLLAKNYLKEDFFLLNAYHFDFLKFSKLFKVPKKKDEAILLAKKDSRLSQYGILKTEKDRVLKIIEKPKKGEEPSTLRIVGIYLLSKMFIDELEKTPPEHYHLEKTLSSFAKKGLLKFVKTDEESVSLKYPWDLLSVKNILMKDLKTSISKNCKIAKSAEIKGEVIIEDGVEILEGAKIKGPCFIGRNSLIGNNSILRDGVDIGENCVIGANMEMKNSIIMDGSKTHSGFIGDSIIGKNCRIAAQFCASNRRLDRGFINSQVKGGKVDTGLKFLGAIIGSNVSIGIKSSTMPGVIIGNNSVIGPSTNVLQNVENNTKYYSKFKEVVLEKMKKIVLFDIDYTLFNTDHFKSTNLKEYALYEETIDVIKRLSEISELGIFSQGENNFQNEKLQKTNIRKYFPVENVHIFEKKELELNNVLVKYKNRKVVLIDDKLNVLHNAKKILPSLYTIWVKRGIYAQNQKEIKGFSPDIIVTDLHDIIAFIEKA